jgi:hydrogenase maturation factor HypF (carbamoyltransferase family)
MTFEEINRTMEFILQYQAQTSVRLDELAKNQARHEDLFAQMAVQGQRMSDLLEIQSRRLDRAENADQAAQRRHEELMKRQEELMKEIRSRLDRPFDRLP